MRAWAAGLFAFLLLQASPALAQSSCANPPPPVRAYLAAHPGWSVATVKDLGDLGATLWKKPAVCPGWAAADLDGNGRIYYGLALLRRTKSDLFEKMVLLSPPGVSPPEETLDKEWHIGPQDGGPYVVEHGPPGLYPDLESGKDVRFDHDVLVKNALGASTQLFFHRNGRTRSLWSTD